MIEVKVSNSEITKALRDIKKYSTKKHNEVFEEMRSTAFKIDRNQKDRLRKHMSGGKNYSSLIAKNKVMVNKAGMSANITNDHEAAVFIDKGTKAHPIPKSPLPKGRVLATRIEYTKGYGDNVSGDWVYFGKQVQHPGTKAQPFFLSQTS